MAADERLYSDPELAQFYDLENSGGADQEFCLRLAKDAQSVLDLGCGTGALLSRLEPGKRAVGVDLAAAMLENARSRPGCERVEWIEADARAVRLGQQFDLIWMTGHAFQVFLCTEDRLTVLRTIAAHLTPGGQFIFDSRNPLRQAWRSWTRAQSAETLEHPRLGLFQSWSDHAFDPELRIVTYHSHYRSQDGARHYAATSKIGFPDKHELETLLGQSGLRVDKWLGDWQGGDWHQGAPEIIPLGRLFA